MDVSSENAVYPTTLAAWIEVSGEDAPHFLQSQFSQDLRVDPGAALSGLWLDHRGRLHGEGVVLKTGEESFIIASLTTPAAGLLEKLESHVIADEVDFVDRTSEVSALLFPGGDGGSAPVAGIGPVAGASYVYSKSCYAFVDRLGSAPVLAIVGRVDQCRGILDTLRGSGSGIWSDAAWDAWRVRNRRPAIPLEIGQGETPADADLGRLCSLTKGCYLGQEVVNRQARLERSAKSLCVVRMDSSLPVDGKAKTPLPLSNASGETVGSLRASARDGEGAFGLAMIKNKGLDGECLQVVESAVSVEVIE